MSGGLGTAKLVDEYVPLLGRAYHILIDLLAITDAIEVLRRLLYPVSTE